MWALCLDDKLSLREIPRPSPKPNQALVEISVAGICNTDLEIVKGYMGFRGVLGHEFVGVVEEAAQSEWVGKRVCGEINFGCGVCEWCTRGLSRHCPNRTVLGILNQPGAFAEFAVFPVENLREVPETVPDRSAVFVEPVAAAFEILEQLHVEPTHKVAVIGDGKLGLLICQVLKLTGCDVTLFGKHPSKLAIAKSLNVQTSLVDEVPRSAYDVVVEASGAPTGFEMAMELVRPRGTIVLKSTYEGHLQLNAAPIVIDEITVLGSRCGQFEPAIRALAENRIQVEPLVDESFPFNRALEAFEKAKKRSTLKVLLDFG